MVAIRAVPPEHDDSVRAGLDAILAATKCSSERMSGIPVVVENKVRMPVTFEPSRDLRALVGDSGSNSVLRALAIVPGGSRRDVVFACETFAKFGVASPDVLAKSMASSGFVLGEIVTTFGKGRSARGTSGRCGMIARAL